MNKYNLVSNYTKKLYKNIVLKAFSKIKYNLNSIQIFHTDRGLEFKNRSIDKILETFNITRSLSNKGCG